MKRNSEAVRLVTHLLDQVQRCRATGQHHRTAFLPGHEQLFVAFSQAAQRDIVDAHFVEHLKHGIELRTAAVKNDQVRFRAKTLIFHAFGAIAALHDFLHAQEVIRFVKLGFYLETTVLILRWLAVFEHDHRCHGIRTVVRGNVEAFNAMRRALKSKSAFQLKERVIDALVIVIRTHFVAHQSVTRIRFRQVQKVGFLPFFGCNEMHFRTVLACQLVGKPLAHGGIVFRKRANNHLARN